MKIWLYLIISLFTAVAYYDRAMDECPEKGSDANWTTSFFVGLALAGYAYNFFF